MLPCGAPKDEGEGLCGAPLLHGTTLAWFSGLHLLTPGDPLRWGNVGCRGFVARLGSCIPVRVARPQFGIWCSCLCSGRYRSRFSRFCRAYFARFSLLGGWTVRACGYVGFLLWSFVGSALTAIESLVLVDNVMENQIIRSLNRTNAFFQYGSAQPIW